MHFADSGLIEVDSHTESTRLGIGYLSAHVLTKHYGDAVLSNFITFLIVAVIVVECSHCRPSKTI